MNKKIKRIILTYPNQRWHKYDLTTTWNLSPYSLCLLAAMIQDKYGVKIIDAQFYNMTIEQYKNEIINYNPDCVGISLLTSEYCSILDTAASVVKSINSNILTIAGGVHVTTQYCNVMKNKNIDFAIRGEGEYVFRDFLDYINGEKERPKKGLVYREENDEIVTSFINLDIFGYNINTIGIDTVSFRF